jgi:hypothetical protein
MKNILKFLVTILLTSFILNSCTDSESIYIAIPPVDGVLLINPTATDIVLSKENKDQTAISFSWDVSDYNIDTPLQYTLEIDTLDGDFSNPETEITESTELSMTHARLNTIALSKDLITDVKSEIKVRLKTALKYGALPSYSKIETIAITPYEDLAVALPSSGELFIQGNAVPTNWNYPIPDTQKMTQIPNKPIFTITIELIGNKNIAFLSSNQFWGDPAYKGLVEDQPTTRGSFTENAPPDWAGFDINSPPLTGIYEIVINFRTGKYTVTAQ